MPYENHRRDRRSHLDGIVAHYGRAQEESRRQASAVREFVNRRKAREFGTLLRGAFDYPSTNEEIEASDH